MEYWELLIEEANSRHGKKFKITPKKDKKLMWKTLNFGLNILVHWAPKILTFGLAKTNPVDIFNSFDTVIGYTLYTASHPIPWEKRQLHVKNETISHEIDHLDALNIGDHDARRFGKAPVALLPWHQRMLNMLKYLIYPLPFKYATYRQNIEKTGYERTLEHIIVAQKGKVPKLYRLWLIKVFSGPEYGWMATPKKAEVIADEIISNVEKKYRAGKIHYSKYLKEKKNNENKESSLA